MRKKRSESSASILGLLAFFFGGGGASSGEVAGADEADGVDERTLTDLDTAAGGSESLIRQGSTTADDEEGEERAETISRTLLPSSPRTGPISAKPTMASTEWPPRRLREQPARPLPALTPALACC